MPRLFHPINGAPVDVPDNDRPLLAYYRAEGFTDEPPDLPAPEPPVDDDGPHDDPDVEPGDTLPASGEQPLSGISLES